MKFLTFERNGQPRLGLVTDGGRVIDVAAAGGPADLLTVVKGGDAALQQIRRAAEGAKAEAILPLDALKLLPPLPHPTKNVFCVGRNYAAHVAEGARARGQQGVQVPEFPEFFSKATTAINAHEGLVPLDPKVTGKFDYEVELGVVIGKAGKNIAAAQAMDHVFGFTIVNDFTARDLQRRHGQWFKGKTLDGTCPIGPVVVARAALANYGDLAIRLRVNGEQRQNDRTSSMVHKVENIIESLSAGLTLEPGDVIATGTPSGVGFAMNPPQFLKGGDVVEAEIEGIGILRNTIREV
jgi:2-keto-4-pentenoate hydratase/2-oxohepta-3-ene-1,7-dioic acid hydratase in catechol pathway